MEEEIHLINEKSYTDTTNSLIGIINETIPDVVKAIQDIGRKVNMLEERLNKIEQVLNNHHHDDKRTSKMYEVSDKPPKGLYRKEYSDENGKLIRYLSPS